MFARSRSTLLIVLLAVLTVLFPGCDETDATSIRITLNADGSGTVRTSQLLAPESGKATSQSPEGLRSVGIDWNAGAAVRVSTGTFGSIDQLALGGMRCELLASDGGDRTLRVGLLRGSTARWASGVGIADEQSRRRLAGAIDPEGDSPNLGERVKIVVDLPADAVSSGVSTTMRGMESFIEDDRAVLIVPVSLAVEDGPEIVWFINWQQ